LEWYWKNCIVHPPREWPGSSTAGYGASGNPLISQELANLAAKAVQSHAARPITKI
jgi:hypothetical protein